MGAAIYALRPYPAGKEDGAKGATFLVATKDLTIGDPIKEPEKMFTEMELLNAAPPAAAIRSIESVRNRVMRRSVRAGDLITADDLFSSPSLFWEDFPL